MTTLNLLLILASCWFRKFVTGFFGGGGCDALTVFCELRTWHLRTFNAVSVRNPCKDFVERAFEWRNYFKRSAHIGFESVRCKATASLQFHFHNRIVENVFHVASTPVESETKFVNVFLHMLPAHAVINAVIPAFEQHPK